MRKPIIQLILSAAVVLGLGSIPETARPVRAYSAALAPEPYDLTEAVNSLRASRGLTPYAINPILMGTAQRQADHMAATGQVTHYGPDGSRPFQRAIEAGYAVAGDLSLGGWFSENIMGGRGFSAQEVVTAWLGDAPHTLTMLSPNLEDIGAGVTADGNYYYFVIDCGQAGTQAIPTHSSGAGEVAASTQAVGQESTGAAVIVSTPDEKGNVYHTVETGQTLWDISVAYRTTVEVIKRLNSLPSNLIFTGQKLLIRRLGTPTPPPLTPTSTRILSTPIALPLFVLVTPSPSPAAAQLPVATTFDPAGAAGIIGLILVIALTAAALMSRIGSRRSS